MVERYPPLMCGFGTLLLAGVVVQGLSMAAVIDPYTVPSPVDAILAIGRIVAEENALGRMMETAREVVVAGVFTIAIGLIIGTLLHLGTTVRHALIDWVAALAAAPLVLAFPLFLVLLGRTSSTVVVMSVISAVVPMILKTVEGLGATRQVLINVGQVLNMTGPQIFRKILLPSALPVLFTGVRLSWTFVLISVVGIEFLISLDGLGQLINELSERYDLPGTYAAILLAILVSVLFFMVLEFAERWLQRRS